MKKRITIDILMMLVQTNLSCSVSRKVKGTGI